MSMYLQISSCEGFESVFSVFAVSAIIQFGPNRESQVELKPGVVYIWGQASQRDVQCNLSRHVHVCPLVVMYVCLPGQCTAVCDIRGMDCHDVRTGRCTIGQSS